MSEIVNDAKFTVVEATKQLHVDGTEKITLKTTASGNGSLCFDSTNGGVSVSGSSINLWGALNVTNSLTVSGDVTLGGSLDVNSLYKKS